MDSLINNNEVASPPAEIIIDSDNENCQNQKEVQSEHLTQPIEHLQQVFDEELMPENADIASDM